MKTKAGSALRWFCVAIGVAAAPGVLAQQPGSQPTSSRSGQPTTITMDQLDDRPESFLGRQITVEAEVEQVLGPRLFTIDEYEWFDFDGDTLVFIHAPLAGLVSEDARVTVTGTVQPFVRAEVEREWGIFDLDPEIEVEFKRRPILVATSVKSDRGLELTVRLVPMPPASAASSGQAGATGTSGSTGAGTGPALTDVSQLAMSMDRRLVGRQVNLNSARVVAAGDGNSVWVSAAQGQDRLLVVPMEPSGKVPTVGQTVSIQGVVLEAPDSLYARARQKKQTGGDEEIYVFATRLEPVQR